MILFHSEESVMHALICRLENVHQHLLSEMGNACHLSRSVAGKSPWKSHQHECIWLSFLSTVNYSAFELCILPVCVFLGIKPMTLICSWHVELQEQRLVWRPHHELILVLILLLYFHTAFPVSMHQSDFNNKATSLRHSEQNITWTQKLSVCIITPVIQVSESHCKHDYPEKILN